MNSVEWPEQFVYVCAATQGAIVNTLPIRYAGIERIARVYVLCGASSNQTQDPGERREAADPAARLHGFIQNAAASMSARPDFEPLFGNPDDFSVWQEYMRSILDDARNAGLPVVLALTGGRKPMTIGLLQGAIDIDRERVRLVNVRGRPLRVEFVEGLLNGDGRIIRQANAIQHDHLLLDEYLDIYGVRENDPSQRHALEQRYREDKTIIEAFAHSCLEAPSDAIMTLNFISSSLFGVRGEFIGGQIDVAEARREHRQALHTMLGQLVGMKGIEKIGDNQYQVTDEYTARLLHGAWLEAYMFNRIAALVSGRNDVEIRANLRLTQHANDFAEIDLALYIRDQFHIVEAKTSNFGKRAASTSGGQSIAQVDSLKRLLQAQHGRTWIVNPRESKRRLANGPGDFIPRAQTTAIELLLGRGAVNDLVGHVRKLLA